MMRISQKLKRQIPLFVMVLPPCIILLVYFYGPMFGLVMAFQRFTPADGFFGSEWVGLENFHKIFEMHDVPRVIGNTFKIATLKIISDTLAAIVVAILLNEITNRFLKKTVQTIIFFPYFLSWVILGGVFRDVLATDGLVNILLEYIGVAPIRFLSDPAIFPWTLVATQTWQITGFGMIVFLAAIVSIDPVLYEAACIDGACRLRQIWYITLPGMSTTIVLMLILSMGYVLNAGFDQILNLYSPIVYETGDVIDTWVFRMGLRRAQFSIATAFGLFRSLVSLILLTVAYYIAYKKYDYRVF